MNKLAFVVVLISLLQYSCNNEQKNDILEGKVKRETVSLAPKVAGRILKIKVKEGDIVKMGDTLAILDVPEVEAKISQAEGAVFAAKSQYEMAMNGATDEERSQVIAAYNAAHEQFIFAEKSMKRISTMYKDSLVSSQVYDETLAKFNSAKAQLDAVNAKKKEVLKSVRGEKIHMAQGQMNQAKGAEREAHVAYSERYILAPKDMSIETIALQEGELALPGYNVFVGYNVHSGYFRFTIAESKIKKIKKGDEYQIDLPFINKTVKAKLVTIKELAKYGNKSSAYPNYQMGEAVYELKLVPQTTNEIDSLCDNYTAIIKL